MTEEDWKSVPKPPLGMKSEVFWIIDRIQDLTRAIYEYSHVGYGQEFNAPLLLKWTKELHDRLDSLKGDIDEAP